MVKKKKEEDKEEDRIQGNTAVEKCRELIKRFSAEKSREGKEEGDSPRFGRPLEILERVVPFANDRAEKGGCKCSIGKDPVQKWTNDQNAAIIPKRTQHKKGEDRKEMQKETTMVRCTSLNGSSWSAEKKYMRRYAGTFEIFFGVEQRMRKGEIWRSSSIKKRSKDGYLQPKQQESPMRMQAVKIASTNRVEFLLLSIVTWEQFWQRRGSS